MRPLTEAEKAKFHQVQAMLARSEEKTKVEHRDDDGQENFDAGGDHEFAKNLLGLPDDERLLTGPAGLFDKLTDVQKIGLLVMRQGERHAGAIKRIALNGCSKRESDLTLIYGVKERVSRIYWMLGGISLFLTLIVIGIEIYRGLKHAS